MDFCSVVNCLEEVLLTELPLDGFAEDDAFVFLLICPPLAWADVINENDKQHINVIILNIMQLPPIYFQ